MIHLCDRFLTCMKGVCHATECITALSSSASYTMPREPTGKMFHSVPNRLFFLYKNIWGLWNFKNTLKINPRLKLWKKSKLFCLWHSWNIIGYFRFHHGISVRNALILKSNGQVSLEATSWPKGLQRTAMDKHVHNVTRLRSGYQTIDTWPIHPYNKRKCYN